MTTERADGRDCVRRPGKARIPFALCVAGAIVVCLQALTGDGLALVGDIRRDPAEMVRKFLELDTKGARLDAMSREAVRPYLHWKDEPVWGQVLVIAEYKVIEDVRQWEVRGATDVIIPVEFQVLGALYFETASFVPDPQVERVGFRVKAVQGLWKLTEPLLPPHVGYQRMVNYVRQAALDEQDQARAEKLKALRQDLGRVKPKK